ncbi:MAG: acetylglutamate kinase [Leptospira sp.]|nr:acetylglutamate kinase [Leptospira sp.]
MEARQLLTKVLEITEDSPDGWKYLQYFRSQPKERFAVVCPSPDSLMDSWNVLFHDLRVLWQLDLFPVVMIDISTLRYIKTFLKAGLSLEGESSFPIRFIRRTDNMKSRIQEIISVHKKIPVIVSQQLHDLDIFLKNNISNLLEELNSNKLILLNQSAGIRDENSNRYSIINLSREYESLKNNKNSNSDDLELLGSIKHILDSNGNRRLNVSITSPSSLLKELFTIKGSGTLIKRGSKIQIFDDFHSLDRDKLQKLIENSFQRKCKPGFMENNFYKVILESEYKACALFLQTESGVLLSKFAVDEIARGEGVGREIWDLMKQTFPSLFWRAKISNPISHWYMKEADGMIKTQGWIYFWMGESWQNVPKIIEYLSNLGEDWLPEKY